MSEQNKDEFKELRELWNLLCSINVSKSLDLPQLVQLLAMRKREVLVQWTSEADFDELCREGCSEVSLALALWAIEASQSIEQRWRKTVPSARRRKQIVRILEKAADVLEELQNSFSAAILEGVKKSLPEDLRKSVNLESGILNIVSNMKPKWPQNAPAPHPANTIRALRLYARVLSMFHAISEETQAHSSDSIPKYLISAYVKRATGDFHDAQVSALIGSALGSGTYDETAHRMWRSRNYEPLEEECSSLVELLMGIGVVTALKT
jgi:hypothetical protein